MNTRRAFLLGLAATPIAASASAQTWSQIIAAIKSGSKPAFLITSARKQIGVTTTYDPAYVRLAYPNGDVTPSVGVCIDVIIRAYRDAFDYDFQKSIHEDMAANFSAYPKTWGLTRTDKNIDHRRVPNIETFLKRAGRELSARDWQAGDLLTCRLGGNLPHIAIVSERIGADGLPKVIHNIGRGAQEESLIGLYENERRFRFFPSA